MLPSQLKKGEPNRKATLQNGTVLSYEFGSYGQINRALLSPEEIVRVEDQNIKAECKSEAKTLVIHFLMNNSTVDGQSENSYPDNIASVPDPDRSKASTALLADALELYVDYRPSGGSRAKYKGLNFTPDDLVDDAVEFVELMQARYPQAKIVLHGHSLGGAVATKAARRLYEKTLYVKDETKKKFDTFLINDRSFASTTDYAVSYSSVILKPVISGLLWLTGYNFDVAEDYAFLPKDRKMLISSDEDEKIKREASLAAALPPAGQTHIRIQAKLQQYITREGKYRPGYTHSTGLQEMELCGEKTAVQAIAELINDSYKSEVSERLLRYNPNVFKAAEVVQYAVTFAGLATGMILHLQYAMIDINAAYGLVCSTAIASSLLGTFVQVWQRNNIITKDTKKEKSVQGEQELKYSSTSVIGEAVVTSVLSGGLSAGTLAGASYLSGINVLQLVENTVLHDAALSIHTFTSLNLPFLLETAIPALIILTLLSADIISASTSEARSKF